MNASVFLNCVMAVFCGMAIVLVAADSDDITVSLSTCDELQEYERWVMELEAYERSVVIAQHPGDPDVRVTFTVCNRHRDSTLLVDSLKLYHTTDTKKNVFLDTVPLCPPGACSASTMTKDTKGRYCVTRVARVAYPWPNPVDTYAMGGLITRKGAADPAHEVETRLCVDKQQ